MNTKPKPLLAAVSPVPIQAHLRFDLPKPHSQIPEEKRAEFLALLRELIEVVAARPNCEEGGANE